MASAKENDLNPNTTIGLSFPLRGDAFNDFAMTKNSLEQSLHNLRNLLLTHIGERVNQPQFGSTLRALCFEQQDEELPVNIKAEVIRAVSVWLPYINIQEVTTLTEEGDKGKVFVQIEYSTTLNASTQQQITLDAGGSGAQGNY